MGNWIGSGSFSSMGNYGSSEDGRQVGESTGFFALSSFGPGAQDGGMNIRNAISHDAAVITDFNIRLALESEDLQLDLSTVTQGVATLLKDPSKGIYLVAETSE